jgi:hypothetical protein
MKTGCPRVKIKTPLWVRKGSILIKTGLFIQIVHPVVKLVLQFQGSFVGFYFF